MYPKLRKIRGLIAYDEYLDMAEFLADEYKEDACNTPTLY
jgi:hypothetical protein